MDSKFNTFLNLHIRFSNYGPSRFQDSEYAKSYTLSFTEDEFIKHVYVPVDLEKIAFNEISSITNGSALTRGNLIALCGPAGSGKSTVSHVIKRKLNDEYRTKLIFIDLRPEEANLKFDNKTDLDEAEIRAMILSHFEKEIKLNPDNLDSNLRVKLYHFLLSSEDHISPHTNIDLFNPFSSLRTRAALIYHRVAHNHDSFEDWFMKFGMVDLYDLILKVEELIDIGHYVAFNKFLDRYDDYIIWLDNIDAMTDLQQSQLLYFLENIHRNFLSSSTIVVSVREENVYRTGYYKDNHNEPFVSKITFEDPEKAEEDLEVYESLNIPVLPIKTLKKIVSKKLEFTHLKYKECIANLNQKIEKFKNQIAFSEQNNIASKIQKLQNELDKFTTDQLSNLEFDQVKKVSDKIIEVFGEEKVIFLSNNSIKEFIRIHSSYLNRIFKEKNIDHIDYPGMSLSSRITNFLSWIHRTDAPFGLDTLNVFDETGKYFNRTERTVSCFLPYLILTSVWNESIKLSNNPSPGNNPYLNSIIGRISHDFEFKEPVIRKAIFDLYCQSDGKGSFVTFRSKRLITHPEDLDDQTTIRVTYRGKISLGFTMNSYGYLRECISINKDELKGSEIEELMLEKISEIANLHLDTLKTLKETKFSDKKDWLDRYYYRYGIPLDPQFVRYSKIGRDLPLCKFNRALYMETVFHSLTNYFHKPNQYKKMYQEASGDFFKKLEKIT